MNDMQKRLDEIADAIAQIKSAAETASRALGDDTQKHVMALNLGMILGLAARAEEIVKNAKRTAIASTGF